jgi:hypothetical protein
MNCLKIRVPEIKIYTVPRPLLQSRVKLFTSSLGRFIGGAIVSKLKLILTTCKDNKNLLVLFNIPHWHRSLSFHSLN